MGVERSISPDLRLTTVVEMRGLGRYLTGYRSVLAAMSQKLADRIALLAPGEPLVVGNVFRFTTLEQTLQLVYSVHIPSTIWCAWPSEQQNTLGQLLYRKERGKISRFDMSEEVATKLFISRFQGGFDGHWSWSTQLRCMVRGY